ncbi:SDR family NAD(P)-dependent oxidoreductase, partial [Bacillus sp. JJ722]|uniref:SDR family NAD(P)-dependent oxidoreductase n=1 Tax=Bacillus sp. JJ722 TaxID=3122973 RepID=UPI0030000166
MTIINENQVKDNVTEANLKGKIAIVTGGSRGIGATIAKVLAANGASVMINYNTSKDAAESVIGEINHYGGTAIACKANVGNLEEAQHLIDETKDRFGRVDILVNNAGITRDRTFRKLSADEWYE